MPPETIGAIFTGLTGLVAALAAYAANRSRRAAGDVRVLRRELRRLERITQSSLGHIFQLELVLTGHGWNVPDRPMVLEQFYAENELETGEVTP